MTEADGIAGLDQPVLDQAIAWRSPGLDHAVTLYTDVGGPVGMPIVATVLTLLMVWRWRSRTPLVLVLIAAVGSLAMTTTGKAAPHGSAPVGEVAGPDPLLGRGVVVQHGAILAKRTRRHDTTKARSRTTGPSWLNWRVNTAVVEVAGIEPASTDGNPGLLRVQCAVDFLGPSARAHTSTDRPSRVRVPRSPPT